MRRMLFLLVTTTLGVIAAPAIEVVEGDAPLGVGTGVTKSIAPPGETVPKECVSDYAGNFGIAVEMAPIWTPFRNVVTGAGSDSADMDMEEPVAFKNPKAFSGSSGSGGGAGSGAGVAAGGAAASPKQPKPTPTPASNDALSGGHGGGHEGMVMAEGVIRAPVIPTDAVFGGPDTTVTVKSTRYTTKTYTVSRLSSPVASAISDTPTRYSAPAGNVIKAAVIRQIEDGQVQVPHVPTEITLKPTQTPFAPLSSGQQRISQIGDGQIQNNAPKATAAPGYAGAASAPKATAAGGAGPAPQAAPAPPAAPAPKPAPLPAAAPAPMGGMEHGGHNMVKRQVREFCPKKDSLGMSLKGSVLKDSLNRTGYAAGNMQFQFVSLLTLNDCR
jgi:hypothetical protein